MLINIPILICPTIEEIEYSKALYGNAFIRSSCEIKTTGNQNCPDPPSKLVRIDDNREILLCERCYENVRAEVYGNLSVDFIREIKSSGA
jgi:hypothetical protein